MQIQENPPGTTRERLLESACELFANKGYRNVTIAGICEHASANVASINDYFGDKSRLYAEVWPRAYKIARGRHPLDAGLDDTASPETRLHAFVSGIAQKTVEQGARRSFPPFDLQRDLGLKSGTQRDDETGNTP